MARISNGGKSENIVGTGGDTVIDSNTIDPAALGTGDSIDGGRIGGGWLGGDVEPIGNSNSDAAPKRRGRPPGSKNGEKSAGPRKASVVSNVDSIAFSLHSIHGLLATVLSAPEIAVTEEEAQYVASSYQAWARHHDVTVSAKTIDTGNLIVALAVVYGSRAVAISQRKKNERKTEDAPYTPSVVTPINQGKDSKKQPEPVVKSRKSTRDDDAMLSGVPMTMF